MGIAQWQVEMAVRHAPAVAGIVGGSTPVVSFGDPLRAEVATLDTETYPKAEFTVRFADDQDLNWEVGPDLRPRKHTVRDW